MLNFHPSTKNISWLPTKDDKFVFIVTNWIDGLQNTNTCGFFFFAICHLEGKYGYEYNYYKDFLESNKKQIPELPYWQKGIGMKQINNKKPKQWKPTWGF